MSKESNEFKEIVQERPPAVAQEPVSFAKVLEGLHSAAGAAWDGAARHAEHGAAELMSAAYTGNAYVPYGWNKTPDGADQAVEAPKTPEPVPEKEMGGREM